MKTYWNNLNERERWALGFCGVFLGLLLSYMMIFSPLMHAVQNKSQQLLEKQETLVWLQQASQQQKMLKAPLALSNSKLLSVLSDQLKSTSFHTFPYQLQQTGTKDIQLSFEQVPYNAFITWLWSVRQTYAFSIKQFNVERTGTPGVVKLLVAFVALEPPGN